LFIAALLWSSSLPAQTVSQQDKENEQIYIGKKGQDNRFIATPFLFYKTETSFGAGAAASYIFQLGPSRSTNPSSITPFTIYTLKNQFRALVGSNLYFKENKFHLVSELRFEKFPSKFFGIGNTNQHSQGEDYTPEILDYSVSFSRRISRSLELGLAYHLSTWKLREISQQGQLASPDIIGNQGGTVSGLGLTASLDTRDHIFYPTKGYFVEILAHAYTPLLGSTYTYQSLSLNIRRYFKIFNEHVVAFQSLVKTQWGEVPFCQLAQMGGEFFLRGYYEGRFRDKNLLLLQGEYRLPLFWRLGMVGFVGLGRVADRLGQLSLRDMNMAWGIGLRYLLDKQGKIRLRIDLGFGHDSTGFYISFYETF
jgi:outer membrane protein assembly factor BamA